eukprot:SAG31_NODE_141_length_22675_cov_48.948879_6_plen_84_part_00
MPLQLPYLCTASFSPDVHIWLAFAGIKYTLVGHSERRDIFGEDEDLLGAKIAHAQKVGMKVIACIGEHKEDREAGKTMGIPPS